MGDDMKMTVEDGWMDGWMRGYDQRRHVIRNLKKGRNVIFFLPYWLRDESSVGKLPPVEYCTECFLQFRMFFFEFSFQESFEMDPNQSAMDKFNRQQSALINAKCRIQM